MSVIDTLITDRAQADIDRVLELAGKGLANMTAAERTEYLTAMKGSYNVSDLNRVREAMAYVAEHIREYGYIVIQNSMTAFTRESIPTPAQLQVYLDNLKTLRSVLTVLPTTPAVPPDMDGLTVEEANDIEKLLADLDRLIVMIAESLLRCNAYGLVCAYRSLPTENGLTALTWAELDAMNLPWPEWDRRSWSALLYGYDPEDAYVFHFLKSK